jgi:hypothetical protein
MFVQVACAYSYEERQVRLRFFARPPLLPLMGFEFPDGRIITCRINATRYQADGYP